MSLDQGPPAARTPDDNHATLLVSWWATLSALFIILVRVIGRYVRLERLFMEDKMMAWAVVPLLIRMGLVHVVLLYGTNNTTTDTLTADSIYHRSIGARAVLAARIFYAMFIWISKLTVSEFLKRLTAASWSRKYEYVLQAIRAFLLFTFIGVVIGTLSECQPFNHYWQVVPSPAPGCRNGYAQLFVMGISDIITDVVLILFPLPVLLRSSMPLKRRISLCLLYSLSVILIAIAAYRIPAIVAVHGRQQRRSLWASIEILASAACSNAVIIGSFVRDRGVKKQKYKREVTRTTTSAEMPSFNRAVTRQHWGNDSDEDLFRSVRGRMNSLASHEAMDSKRPDIVQPLATIRSPRQRAIDDVENGQLFAEDRLYPWQDKPGRHASESLSFHDAGGLLDAETDISPTQSHNSPQSSSAYDFAASRRNRGPSPAASSLGPPQAVPGAPEWSSRSQSSDPVENPHQRQTLPPNGRPTGPGDGIELHDAGGLLT